MDNFLLILGLIGIAAIFSVLVIVLLLFSYLNKERKKSYKKRKKRYKKSDNWIDTNKFHTELEKLNQDCNTNTVLEFIDFLHYYKGAYIKRENGKIVSQKYSRKELYELKSCYFKVVHTFGISPLIKESFRVYLKTIGVTGIDENICAVHDGELKNKEENEDEFEKKEAGNKGELIVRDTLKSLDKLMYTVFNGVVLRYNDTVHEFDHIVVSNRAVFLLETKAFGLSAKDGNDVSALLTVGSDGKWILRKYNKEKELTDPSQQIEEEILLLQKILENSEIVIVPVLVLAKKDIKVKINNNLNFKILTADKLVSFISSYEAPNTNVRYDIINKIGKCRLN